MAEMKILAADADPISLNYLHDFLSVAGFKVFTAGNGLEVLDLSQKIQPDLITLEVNLPGMNGFQTCIKLRQSSTVPIIFVSDNNSTRDRIWGLSCGSDDYVCKPFDSAELVLRIKGILRRSGKLTGISLNKHSRGDRLAVNPCSRTVKKGEKVIFLTAKEFELLWLLFEHPGRVYTREQLAYQIWSTDFYETAAINMLVKRVREKIEDDPTRPKWIQSVRGVGYKFECEHY